MSSTVIHVFYFTIRIFSMSPTFRRTMGVQKHLFAIERSVIKELLKLKTNACLFTIFLFLLQITLKRSRAPRREISWNVIFNV